MCDSDMNISTYFKSLSPLYTYIQPRFFDIQTFSLCSSHLLVNVYILALAYPPCHLQPALRDTNYPCLKCCTPLLGISPFLIDHCCCGYSIFCRDYHICWIPLLKLSTVRINQNRLRVFAKPRRICQPMVGRELGD